MKFSSLQASSVIAGFLIWSLLLAPPTHASAIRLSKGLQPVNKVKDSEGRVRTKADQILNPTQHQKPFKNGSRHVISNGVKSIFSKVLNQSTKLMIGTSNFVNGRTNINIVDSYATAFNNLLLSTGGSNFNNYYFAHNNFWVIYDSITMFIRGIENRNINRIEDAKDAAQKEEADEVIDETVETLNEANAQLVEFKNNLAAWICRNAPNIARNGVLRLRRRTNQREDRQIDCSSLVDRFDEHYWDEEEDQDDEEDLEDEKNKENNYLSPVA